MSPLGGWPALKTYFLSVEQEYCSIISALVCGVPDEDNVHGTVAECVQASIHNVLQEFDSSIIYVESDSATVIDIHNHFQDELIARRKDQFYGNKAKQTLRKLLPTQQ